MLALLAVATISQVDGIEHMHITQQQAEYQLTSQSDVRLLTRDELIRYGDQSLAEALSRIPGLLLSGPPGRGKDLRLKGLDKGYSQILINGKPAPGNGEKREFDLSSIPLAWVERIEVLPASDATVSGAGIGGSLNIVLKDHRSGNDLQLTTRYLQGSQWQPALSYSHAIHNDLLRARFGLDYSEVDSDKEKSKASTLANGNTTATAETEDKADKRLGLTADVQYQLSETWRLNSQARYIEKNEDKLKRSDSLKNGAADKLAVEHEDKQNRFFWFDNSAVYQLNKSTLTLDLGFRDQREQKDKLKDETDSKGKQKLAEETEDKKEQLTTAGARWASNKFIVGLEQQWRNRYRLKYKDGILSGGKDSYDFDENVSALYSRYNFKAAGNWSLGLRAERMAREAVLDGQLYDAETSWDLLPNVKYQAKLTDAVSLRLSASRTVRWPKFDDMVPFTETKDGTLTDPDKAGNADLQPEKAWGLDSALVVKLSAAELEFYANRRWVEDLIINNTQLDADTGRYVQLPVNLASGISSGWGARLNWQLADSLTAAASADWQQIDGGDVSSEFKQVPQMYSKLNLDWQINNGWQAGMSVGYQSSMEKREFKNNQYSRDVEKAMTTLDVYTSYTFANSSKLSLSLLGLNNPQKRKSKTLHDANGDLLQTDTEFERSSREWVLSYSMPF